jgi:hypothetical protein
MENEQEQSKELAITVSTVNALKVVDRVSYETMANYVLLFRKGIKEIKERAEPRIAEAWKHHKNLVADLKKDLEPIEKAQAYGDSQLVIWDNEQAKIAEREQLQLQALARAREEEERLQLAALAEQAGDKELAEQIINTPSPEPVVVVQKDVPKVEGLSYRQDWKFEVVDWKQIPARYHRMAQNAKGEWHCHVMQDVGAEVSRLKETSAILGVRVYSVKVPIGRS